MTVNWTHDTQTSRSIITKLKSNGVILSDEDKQIIIEETYTAITEAYAYESNGCDCGQMSCSTCHG